MRTSVLTVLLSLVVTATGVAQTSPPPAAPGAPDDRRGDGLLSEPRVIAQVTDLAERWIGDSDAAPKDGFFPKLGGLIPGDGWITVGPGYRKRWQDGHVLLEGSAEISWHAYKEAQVRVELPMLANDHLSVGAQARWQDFTQVDYFGLGENSLQSRQSEYRIRAADVIGYGEVRPAAWLAVFGSIGRLQHPTLSAPSGPFFGNYPDTLTAFAGDPGMTQQPNFLRGDLSVMADRLDHRRHPTSGGFYRAVASVYADRDRHQFSFRRYDAEGLQLLPLAGRTWVAALHARGVVTDTSAGQAVPFYLLPSLGGQNSLRGYDDYRFHDRNMLAASVESRVAIFRHVDVAVFMEAGNVAARPRDLNFAKTSYGAGVRLHTGASTLGRMDVGRSREGWRVWFSFEDPFQSSRRPQLDEIVPFVP